MECEPTVDMASGGTLTQRFAPEAVLKGPKLLRSVPRNAGSPLSRPDGTCRSGPPVGPGGVGWRRALLSTRSAWPPHGYVPMMPATKSAGGMGKPNEAGTSRLAARGGKIFDDELLVGRPNTWLERWTRKAHERPHADRSTWRSGPRWRDSGSPSRSWPLPPSPSVFPWCSGWTGRTWRSCPVLRGAVRHPAGPAWPGARQRPGGGPLPLDEEQTGDGRLVRATARRSG